MLSSAVFMQTLANRPFRPCKVGSPLREHKQMMSDLQMITPWRCSLHPMHTSLTFLPNQPAYTIMQRVQQSDPELTHQSDLLHAPLKWWLLAGQPAHVRSAASFSVAVCYCYAVCEHLHFMSCATQYCETLPCALLQAWRYNVTPTAPMQGGAYH